jgi:flagellar hook-length control protein FliK
MARGDGTHRIRLRLSPEALGDVSVVLTVRKGAVEVTLGAGAQARHALEQGSAELHRLLELSGARTSQVVVKDLSGPSTGPSTGSTTGQDLSGRGTAQHGSPHPGARPDSPAGTRSGGSTAPVPPTAESPRRSVHHPTSLDVTI